MRRTNFPGPRFAKKIPLLVAILSCFGCLSARSDHDLTLNWTNNLLTISAPTLPGGKIEVLYLEAFCHKGSTERDWKKTVLPHKTKLIKADPKHLQFRTSIEPDAVMLHELQATSNGVDIH